MNFDRKSRWGRLCEGILHRHGRDDARHFGGRAGLQSDKLDGIARGVRQAIPHARFLSHFGTVSRSRHRSGLARLSRQEGLQLRLFLRDLGHDSVRFQGAWLCRGAGVGRRCAGIPARLHRAFRHALVHIPPSRLLRGHQGRARRAGGDGVVRGCTVAGRAGPYRLDRDRRVLRALRLFPLGLCARALRVCVRGQCLRPSARRPLVPRGLGPLRGCDGFRGLFGTPGRRAWPRLFRRAGGGGGLDAALHPRLGAPAALCRREFDRRLSRVLPAMLPRGPRSRNSRPVSISAWSRLSLRR